MTPRGHRPLLREYVARRLGRLVVPCTVSDPAQEVVRGELHMLVGKRVRNELSRGVRLSTREQDEALSGQRPNDVFEGGGLCPARLEALTHQTLVALGFGQVV